MTKYDLGFTDAFEWADSKNSDPRGDIRRAIEGMKEDYERAVAQTHVGHPYYLRELRGEST